MAGSEGGQCTFERELGGGIPAILIVADQTQDLAEAGRGQEAAVLRVCNLPYLAQHGRRKLGPLEELDGDLARDDAELLRVGLLEQVLEGALLVGREVQDGMVWVGLAGLPSGGPLQRRTQFPSCGEIRHGYSKASNGWPSGMR